MEVTLMKYLKSSKDAYLNLLTKFQKDISNLLILTNLKGDINSKKNYLKVDYHWG